ncbi:NADH-quinone oxidoreductase subunit NuoG [Ponticaulis sp.]|uniref:NADH-quinone oxidoreductase subunit NuoG n=1 Tax=Ponticaulis sp. TaxID=2020902 RepID=UPI000B6ED0C4|nr:NADH-quinone oxidoreductase subunit NuoG [Ponticaulis sp.]MAI89462.1 NADH-quinone oxidoreductase subunit G [Ponticaulis sp.]OUY00499.1 MAG: NADH-quinone oxidoreductase subunit G [Hyphomonadaceae bacterium TMED5]|tara:strand:- start:112421 stop:114538 length:2118 start_codon:yes stop_codon:yes gene_type:complete
MSDTFKLVVDGTEVEVPRNYTLLQACEEAGAEIPRFCFHERLSVAGNCRMCLVQWVGAPKPIASCAQTVGDMRMNPDGSPPNINTKGDYVEKARNGVMEFLLINHPLDCPICDQGGECDLQDQAVAYGRAGSRYELNKRAVEDKNMGPLVKTIMTRCIQCTRCVRFAAEVAGVEEIGMISRGEDAEITTYLEKSLTSELSGNVIDLCPVGALTSKPYAFNARPWELRKTESIDVMDGLGSAIRIDAKGAAVMRIMPRVNEEVNEEWLSDKSRFVWDGLSRQRLDKPYIRENGKLRAASWNEALGVVAEKLKGDASKIAAFAGDLACVEGMKASKDLLSSLGVTNLDSRLSGQSLGLTPSGEALPRESYILNPTLMGVEDADALLLIGANPRTEAAVWNARIRKAWLWNDLQIGVVGEPHDLTYDYMHISSDATGLKDLGAFGDVLKNAKRPMIVVGEGATVGEAGYATLKAAHELALECGAIVAGEEAWTGFGVLHNSASGVGALDVGFLPAEGGKSAAALFETKCSDIETVVLLGVDEIPMSQLGDSFVIYVGSHGDAGASRADVILPAAAYTEKAATYVNTEGRVQMTTPAVQPKGDAKEEWAIFRALSAMVGKTLPYDSAEALRSALSEAVPSFAGLNFAPGVAGAEALSAALPAAGGALTDDPIYSPVGDFYLTNPIARASSTMAECSLQKQTLEVSAAAE